ncbi:MAG: 2-hydroxyacid dehydrogenase [Proteobacteria bacterium]|nr:MAG: 2-hydroxyacid dehydrogenase [Pseudomonadota bacterium]
MKITLFSATAYDRTFFDLALKGRSHEIVYTDAKLEAGTVHLADGCAAVCAFVNDKIDRGCSEALARAGVRLIALRCAGFNNVDLDAAKDFGLSVARVPSYSPSAIAEHTLGLILCLNRHIHRAYNRTREGNFSLNGLLGFNIQGKTAGIVGTGKIGSKVARLLTGFGCRILAFDPIESPECLQMGVTYCSKDEILQQSDILTLHCPLTPVTANFINADAISRMKPGAMLVNTSRGAILDTKATIKALKSGKIGSLAIDVYEQEADMFFHDRSDTIIQDDVLTRLMTFPNVLVTGHQAFLTREALLEIAETTIATIDAFERNGVLPEAVTI